MSIPSTKRYKYFQSALLDPHTKMSTNKQQRYKSATATPLQYPSPTGTFKIIVGADPVTQRTWYLPKALLMRHSTYFAELCTNPFRINAILDDVDVRAFANFVDYMRSSIYTLNEQILGFRRIHEGIKACLLGQKLGARAYSNAAISSLHMGFEPLANPKTSNMRLSVIRASDVDFVCHNTDTNDIGRGLRQLFFDAVASHWSNCEVNKLVGAHSEYMGEWANLCVQHDDFRITLLASCRTSDALRKTLLKPVNHYLSKEKPVVKQEEGDQIGTMTGSFGVIGDCRLNMSPGSIISSMKWKEPSERRRREKAEAGDENTAQTQSDIRDWLQGQEARAIQAPAGDDWTMVKIEIKSDEETKE
jgi:hypothetical protein